MNPFIANFGIDWKMLLSQVTAFFVLFFVLRFLAYKPILAILKKRQEKIDQGLAQAEESKTRLLEVDKISIDKLKKADQKSLDIIKKTEQKAKALEVQLTEQVKVKEAEMLKKAEQTAQARKQESENQLKKEAVAIVKSIIEKTVEFDPEKIDTELIKKAIKAQL